jgi:hypothetical protein
VIARALARFERVCTAAVARPGAPVGLIRRVRRELLLAIETLPEGQVVALLEEGARYVSRLAGHRKGDKTAA